LLEDDNVEVISKNPNKGTIQGGGILEIKDSTSTDFIVKEIQMIFPMIVTTEDLGDKDIVKEQENRLLCHEAARKSTLVSSQVDLEYDITQVDEQN